MNQNKFDILKHFLKFCKKELNIQSLPAIKLTADKDWVAQVRSFGEYNTHINAVKVYYLNRNIADVCRSLAHELCHHRQNELGLIYNDAGETGTDIENDANAMAGILMRDYGKLNLGVYDLEDIQSLNEAKQVGKLYHFTSYTHMIGIINSNFVLKSPIQPYISFTRNKLMQSDTIPDQVRFTVDGDKLSNKYRFEPYVDVEAGYGRSSKDESEERVSLKRYPNGVDISKAIISVDVKDITTSQQYYDYADFDDEEMYEPPSLSSYDQLLKLLKAKNIPYNIVKSYK